MVLSVRYSVISGSNARICGQRGQNALAVGLGQLQRGHRRPQIGHDDGARELARRVRQHRGERGAVAQMQVPVVGAGEREPEGRVGMAGAIIPATGPASEFQLRRATFDARGVRLIRAVNHFPLMPSAIIDFFRTSHGR